MSFYKHTYTWKLINKEKTIDDCRKFPNDPTHGKSLLLPDMFFSI